MAPLLISGGALLLVLGGAGLFASGNVAGYARHRNRSRPASLGYAVMGAVLLVAGLVLLPR